MSLIADGVLIATCLTAAIYCFVLSRRLRRLTSTEDGIGQQILQLNGALEETRNSVKEIRASSRSASDRLSRETAQAKKVTAELARLVADASAAHARKNRQGSSSAEPKRAAATAYRLDEGIDEEHDRRPGESTGPEKEDADDGALRDLLKDVAGDRELGFMPDAPDSGSQDPNDDRQPAGAEPDRLRRSAGGDASADGQARASETFAGSRSPDDNLLKIERMAL